MLFKNNQISWIYGKTLFQVIYLYEIYLSTTQPPKATAQHLLGAPSQVRCRISIYLFSSLVKHSLLQLLDKQQCDSNETFSESCSSSQCTSSNHFAYLGKVILKKYLCLCNKNHTQLCWHLGIFCFFYLQGIHYLLVDLRIPKCMRLI